MCLNDERFIASETGIVERDGSTDVRRELVLMVSDTTTADRSGMFYHKASTVRGSEVDWLGACSLFFALTGNCLSLLVY